MKKYFSILLANLIWSALYNQHALAGLTDQCLLGVPAYTQPLVNEDHNTQPVYIKADQATAHYPDQITFVGNVNIKNGNSTLSADHVQLQQQSHGEPLRTVTAMGNVTYASNEINLKGPKAWSNLNSKDIDVFQGHYQMVGRQGRGEADMIRQRSDNRYMVLENGSFTACLPGDNSWSIAGSEVIYDRQKQVAKIWKARFKIGKVPVLYSPYLQLPMGNQRLSGFFIPHAKYGSSNGFEFSTPYYLHLAPNYDSTITPHYMSKRGMQLQNEFRYLTIMGDGLVELDWLPHNRTYSHEHSRYRAHNRWLLYWRHNGVIEKVWRFNVNYTKISDSSYLYNLDSKYGSTTDSYATQKFSIGYANAHWDTALFYTQFQVFAHSISDVYLAAPQVDLTYYKNDVDLFDFKVFSQAVKFLNVNKSYPKATRLHIEPTLGLTLANRWGSLNTEAKLMATYYHQRNVKTYNTLTGRHLEGTVNRVLLQFKTNGKIIFERDIDCLPDYTQTLEPQLQYLYVPYRNQNNIGVYDSTILQTDYFGMFRDRSYSGLDRIASANQLAGGVMTRIYDVQGVERFNISAGQIYYLSRPKTGDLIETWDTYDNTGSLVWAGNSYWLINKQLGFRGGLQYDFRLNSLSRGDMVLEYRRDENRILQLNYRYASPQYTKQMLSNVTNLGYQQRISQVGFTGSWLLVNHWSLVGTYYYDIKTNQPSDQLISLQYNTCCWAVRGGYERKITGWNSADSSSKYDNRISFIIELRGLSSKSVPGPDQIFCSSMLPYQRAF